MKTIIYICQFAGTIKNGMNYRPYYLGKYIVKKGYRFIVVGSGFHHQMREPKNLTGKPIIEMIDGIEYIWVPSRKYNAENYIQRILSLFSFPLYLYFFNIKKIISNSNVLAVVSSSPSLITSLPAIRWARKLKAEFIFEVRDIWPMSLVELSNTTYRNPFILFLKALEKRSYRKADKVFSVLSNSKNYMINNGMDSKKFSYIPNGVDGIGRGLDFEEYDNFFEDKFVIAYAGTIGVANNLGNLIKAAKLLKDEKDILFAIVGDGPKKNALVKEAEGFENVLFLPPVRKDRINSLLSQFSAGYLGLQRGEMFEYGISPNKLFDYMIAKIPVLLAVNTTNSIVEKASCGVVLDPDDPKELAKRIIELYKMKGSKRDKMGSNGFEYVTKNHIYSDISDLFLNSIIKDI